MSLLPHGNYLTLSFRNKVLDPTLLRAVPQQQESNVLIAVVGNRKSFEKDIDVIQRLPRSGTEDGRGPGCRSPVRHLVTQKGKSPWLESPGKLCDVRGWKR